MPNELDWNAAENAIYAWAKAAVGSLTLRWMDPNAPIPSTDFGELALSSVTGIGLPEQRIQYDASRDATGQGVELQTGGTEELLLQVTINTAASYGADCATAKLGKARNKLAQLETSERTAMRAAGVTVSRFGPVRSVPALKGAAFRGVAVLEVWLYAQDFASTYTTWIEHVAPTVEVT